VFFENAKGQETCSLRALDAFAKVGGRELLPVHRERLGRSLRGRWGFSIQDEEEEQKKKGNRAEETTTLHDQILPRGF
jgi:hypothetical protein